MAVISIKLSEALDAQLTEQAQQRRLSKSELVRRALTAFLQSPEQGVEDAAQPSAVDLSSNPAYLFQAQ
ncbi:CopG family transcriptional regulator [Cyanobium sp. Copco_Reservoir_LC18]|uniref:ribbon-helix-helix domain-containing protein n=1 Tax=Cyanobium sp. Copco_Reservoir_LC18 TaxID=1328305 RepID=UPI001356D6C2|nr:CopG family transcriptional regulator [Cyanobium sp. Copco_Reservoir_LC18]